MIDVVKCFFFVTYSHVLCIYKMWIFCFNVVFHLGFGKFKKCYFIQYYLTALSKASSKLVEN